MARNLVLTSFFILACSARPSARPALETKLQAAPIAPNVDRLSTLTFERELALPSEARPIRGFIGDGSRFWVRGSLHTWLYGIGRDEPERTLRSLELGRVEYLDESLALVVQNETIYVHEALSGARRFGITIQPPPRAVRLAGAGATLFMVDVHVAAHELYVLATYPGATELVVVDRSSGAVLWRAEAEKGSGSTPCTVSGRVVFATPNGYAAHSARTGEIAWSRPLAPRKRPFHPVDPLLRCSGKWVALFGVSQDELSLVDAATGKVRASFPAETEVVDAAFAGELLIAQARQGAASRLLAIDTERLKLTWQSQPIASDSAPSLRLLGAHALIAAKDFVQIYEPQGGRLVWHWGAANEGPLAFAPRSSSGGPVLAFAGVGGGVSFFKAASVPPPAEAVMLRGTVTYDGAPAANVSVIAYGVETQTNADGGYALSLEARGTIRVVALTPHQGEATVTLDGRGTYDVKIEAFEQCPEGCE